MKLYWRLKMGKNKKEKHSMLKCIPCQNLQWSTFYFFVKLMVPVEEMVQLSVKSVSRVKMLLLLNTFIDAGPWLQFWSALDTEFTGVNDTVSTSFIVQIQSSELMTVFVWSFRPVTINNCGSVVQARNTREVGWRCPEWDISLLKGSLAKTTAVVQAIIICEYDKRLVL